MIGNSGNKPTPTRPSGRKCKFSGSSLLIEGNGNYVPNRKTLGLELVASEEILARHSDWNFTNPKDGGIVTTTTTSSIDGDRSGGAQKKQTTAKSKSMALVATKMTTTLRGFLTYTSTQELPSTKKMLLDGSTKTYDGIVLPVPENELVSKPTTATTPITIRRLEANARDTPSKFAIARKNRIKKMQTRRQNDMKLDATTTCHVQAIGEKNTVDVALTPMSKIDKFTASGESIGDDLNQDSNTNDFIFGKIDDHPELTKIANDGNSFMNGQTFDSAFNFSSTEAASIQSFSNDDTIANDFSFDKENDQEQIEVTDDDNSYFKGLSFDSGFNVSVTGAATAATIAPNVDVVDVDTKTISPFSSPVPMLPTNESSASCLPEAEINSHNSMTQMKNELPPPQIVHDAHVQKAIHSRSSKLSSTTTGESEQRQQETQPNIASYSSPISVGGGRFSTLATINVRDYFCSPIVSSSDIHQLHRTNSFVGSTTDSIMMNVSDEDRSLYPCNDASPILESPASTMAAMKREISNDSPTGVEELTLSEYNEQQDRDDSEVDTDIVSEDKAFVEGIIDNEKYNGDDAEDASWNSLDTHKTVNTCNTSKLSIRRRRSGSITSQKVRRVHFEDEDEIKARDYDKVDELKRGGSGTNGGVQESKQNIDMKTSTDGNDLSTVMSITPTIDLMDGISKLFENCFVINHIGSEPNDMIQSLADDKAVQLLQEDASAKSTKVDDQPLKCIHPPKIHRNLKPIDLFQAKNHNVIEENKSRFEDLNDRDDDDTLEMSTMDSTVLTVTSKETTDSFSIHTEELIDNTHSGCTPIPSWFDDRFNSVLDVIDKVDNSLNGCNTRANDDCSDVPFDEYDGKDVDDDDHDDIEDDDEEDHDDFDDDDDDDDDEEKEDDELSNRGNRDGRRSLHHRSHSRHLRQRERMRNIHCHANSESEKPSEEYRVRFASPARNELGGCGRNVILPSMSDSLLLEKHRQQHISKTVSVDGASEARQADIAADSASKFGRYRSYAQKKRRFRIKRT